MGRTAVVFFTGERHLLGSSWRLRLYPASFIIIYHYPLSWWIIMMVLIIHHDIPIALMVCWSSNGEWMINQGIAHGYFRPAPVLKAHLFALVEQQVLKGGQQTGRAWHVSSRCALVPERVERQRWCAFRQWCTRNRQRWLVSRLNNGA